jgi:hypothetical protein
MTGRPPRPRRSRCRRIEQSDLWLDLREDRGPPLLAPSAVAVHHWAVPAEPRMLSPQRTRRPAPFLQPQPERRGIALTPPVPAATASSQTADTASVCRSAISTALPSLLLSYGAGAGRRRTAPPWPWSTASTRRFGRREAFWQALLWRRSMEGI